MINYLIYFLLAALIICIIGFTRAFRRDMTLLKKQALKRNGSFHFYLYFLYLRLQVNTRWVTVWPDAQHIFFRVNLNMPKGFWMALYLQRSTTSRNTHSDNERVKTNNLEFDKQFYVAGSDANLVNTILSNEIQTRFLSAHYKDFRLIITKRYMVFNLRRKSFDEQEYDDLLDLGLLIMKNIHTITAQ